MYSLALVLLCASAVVAYHVDPEPKETNYSKDKPYYRVDDEKHCQELFEEFIKKYDRNYVSAEERKARYDIFKQNLKDINMRNQANPIASFDINMFADLTSEEFVQRYTGLAVNTNSKKDFLEISLPFEDVPESFDWRDHNVVTEVKQQGGCGSCWTFSSVGNIEGQYALKYNQLISLSEQQLLSCNSSDGCRSGGLMYDAMRYVVDVGGIQAEEDYPYVSENGIAPPCEFSKDKVKVKLRDAKSIDLVQLKEENLKGLLVKIGPISIGLAATNLQQYTEGIWTECTDRDLNHAVLLVGYGSENNEPYWIIKNSWGLEWGEKGYFKLPYGINCLGLINDSAATAIVE